jgi:hypothetical protein
LAFATTGAVFNSPGPARADDPEVRTVGKLPLLSDPTTPELFQQKTGWLILDPTFRRAYEIFEFQASAAKATIVQSFDLDTLKPIRRATITGFVPLPAAYNHPAGSGEVVHAVDEEGARIFLPMSATDRPLAATSNDSQRALDHLAIIDERAFDRGDPQFITKFSIPTDQPLLRTSGLRGMAYYREDGTGRLLSLWADSSPGTGPFLHQLVQWGIDRASDTWKKEDLLGTACGAGRLQEGEADRGMYQRGIGRTPKYILLGCHGSGAVAQAIRIHLTTTGQPDGVVDVRPLPRVAGDVIADSPRSRLLFRTIKSGTAWWVYDGNEDAWLGAVGAAVSDWGAYNSAGLDLTTGRFYSLVPNHIALSQAADIPVRGGLNFTDDTLTPVPQLTTVRPDLAYPSMFRIAIDPATANRPRRLFIRRGLAGASCFADGATDASACNPMVEDFYTVVEDRRSVAASATTSSSDRFTVNVDQKPGVTAANFERGGSAFGTRMLLIGGVSAATTRQFDKPPLRHGSSCLASDREFVFANVQAARATNVAAAATASAVSADPASKLDLEDPLHKCWPTPTLGSPDNILVALGPWPQPDAVPKQGHELNETTAGCTGNAGEVQNHSSAAPGQTNDTKVFCKQTEGTVGAKASFVFSQSSVTVGSTSSELTMSDDQARGKITTVTSEARNVAFGDVTIGLIRATATAWAGGRPGSADAEFKREICNVVVAGNQTEPRCLSDEQQQTFVKNVNQRLAGKGELRLRQPDPAYINGTTGGFQAAVERQPAELFTDTLVTRDFAKPVPALELILYRDDGALGAGRQVFQFAGVEVSSQYGIYCLYGSNDAGNACNNILGDIAIDTTDTTPTGSFSAGVLDVTPQTTPIVTSVPQPKKESPIRRFLRRVAALPGDAFKLIVSRPGDALLLLGLWSLVWLPCMLGERRRAASRLVAARIAGGSQ